MPKETTNRLTKDNVFAKMFSDVSYVFRLYKDLHPEDKDVKLEDVTLRTLDSAFINTLYNDLGFTVGGRLVVLVEAQSVWSWNIPLRMLFYISETYRHYIDELERSEHDRLPIKLPQPDLYVVYSGDEEVPDTLSLKDICFDGLGSLDLEVKVLKTIDGTIHGEYIGFCKEFDKRLKTHGNSVERARETVRACIEKGYLADYLQAHLSEVITMLQHLFDEETRRAAYDRSQRRQYREEGIEIGFEKGIEKGIEEGRLENLKENAASMRAEGLDDELIAKILRVDVADVKIWLDSEK